MFLARESFLEFLRGKRLSELLWKYRENKMQIITKQYDIILNYETTLTCME